MLKIIIFAMTLLLSPFVQGESMRIVSAGASVTEILFALGRGDWVVATDNTSMYPPAAIHKTKLGYFRQLNTEGVLAQHPTHLLGAASTGPQSVLKQLSNAGIAVNIYHQPRTIDGLFATINEISQHVNASESGATLLSHIKTQIATVLHQAQQQGIQGMRALYVVASNDRGLTVAGSDTLPDSLFSELGLVNIGAELHEFKIMDNESIVSANPDIVIMASHFADGEAAARALCSHPAIAVTNAGQHCAVGEISSAISLGLSPRIAEALRKIVSVAAAQHQQARND
ncbi:heme/hemin ABC transporter substrate-binding protein [Alteromonas gilva]|uniref:ABC transporter substrate-binding protein n=1 Tax=Alteromonas gilva TaxID=2987522 RepID=A0ABT5KZ22_9ALTE|nr:ABC transporter substrate-binding protein [Alteromonas gilva]MDC8830011.1 ABC transporter substrate-binding protein [Alteromonas gilva]